MFTRRLLPTRVAAVAARAYFYPTLPLTYFRCVDISRASRGDAAAATWIIRGDESRRRRGCDVESPWRRVAATPWLRRGKSVEGESRRRRGRGYSAETSRGVERRARRLELLEGARFKSYSSAVPQSSRLAARALATRRCLVVKDRGRESFIIFREKITHRNPVSGHTCDEASSGQSSSSMRSFARKFSPCSAGAPGTDSESWTYSTISMHGSSTTGT